MLRTVRNIAIILILAVPVAFVPGGGGIAQAAMVRLPLVLAGRLFLARLGRAHFLSHQAQVA